MLNSFAGTAIAWLLYSPQLQDPGNFWQKRLHTQTETPHKSARVR